MIGSMAPNDPGVMRIINPATGKVDRFWALTKVARFPDGVHAEMVPVLLGRSSGRAWVWITQNEISLPLAVTPAFVLRALKRLIDESKGVC
jgi:hypothetical protein